MQNFMRNYTGWYPRWWLMAAFLCIITIAVGMGIWDTLLCPTSKSSSGEALICHLPDVSYLMQIILIWLLFFVFWLLSFIFGFKIIEIPGRKHGPLADMLQKLTAFEPVHTALLLQGTVAFILINVMWWQDNSPPIAFAFLSICVFVAHCNLFYRSTAEKRRLYLTAYGFLSLVLLIIEGLFKRNFQAHLPDGWLLLCIEGLLVLIGVAAIFWKPEPTTPPTTSQTSTISGNSAISPLSVLGSLWPFNHIIPPQLMAPRKNIQTPKSEEETEMS